jgi:protein-tyrosine phosphatase
MHRVHTEPVTEWEGARNLLDLGGLPTKYGRQTAFGRVWRSAAPEWMTTAGWRAARQAGLVRVVDLRNEIERGRQESHPVVDDSAFAGIDVVHAPTEDPDDPEFLAECGPWLTHPRSWNPNLERYPDKFARVFTAIADAPGPVLVHCAGGRDRTGLVVSMLLALAGVEPDAIAGCYEQGFRGAASHRGHGLWYDPTAGGWTTTADIEWEHGELDRAIADRLPVLTQWLYDTDVADYLQEAGIDTARLDRLRRSIG